MLCGLALVPVGAWLQELRWIAAVAQRSIRTKSSCTLSIKNAAFRGIWWIFFLETPPRVNLRVHAHITIYRQEKPHC